MFSRFLKKPKILRSGLSHMKLLPTRTSLLNIPRLKNFAGISLISTLTAASLIALKKPMFGYADWISGERGYKRNDQKKRILLEQSLQESANTKDLSKPQLELIAELVTSQVAKEYLELRKQGYEDRKKYHGAMFKNPDSRSIFDDKEKEKQDKLLYRKTMIKNILKIELFLALKTKGILEEFGIDFEDWAGSVKKNGGLMNPDIGPRMKLFMMNRMMNYNNELYKKGDINSLNGVGKEGRNYVTQWEDSKLFMALRVMFDKPFKDFGSDFAYLSSVDLFEMTMEDFLYYYENVHPMRIYEKDTKRVLNWSKKLFNEQTKVKN